VLHVGPSYYQISTKSISHFRDKTDREMNGHDVPYMLSCTKNT